jgi:hypothetical protein
MKPEMRNKLAQLPFEEKIRKVGQLIRLTRNMKAHGVSPVPQDSPQSVRVGEHEMKRERSGR